MADYYSIIASAVSRLPSNTDEARHAIYERARTALRETLATAEPSIAANAEAALDAAITEVELDLLFRIMRRFVREEATFFPRLMLGSKIKSFVRELTTNFIDRNRLAPQRAVNDMKEYLLENRNELKRLFDSGIYPLLRYFSSS